MRENAAGGGRAPLTAMTAIAPAVWGTTYIVTTQFLPGGHPLFAGLMRSLPAGIIALICSRSLPRGSWWWKALVLGTLNIGAFFPLLFLTAQRLPGGVAATLGATQPILVAVLVVLVLRERLSVWRVGWGLVGVAGVGMAVLGPGAALDPAGVLAGIAGAASMALGVVLTKRWGRPEGVSALGLAGWQLTAGGLVLLIPTFAVEGVPPHIDGRGVAGYLWLGLIGGLLTYTIWFSGIRRLPVTATAMLSPLSPLVATVLGAIFLGQSLDLIQLAGFVFAVAAMLAGQLTPHGTSRPRRTRTTPAVTFTAPSSGIGRACAELAQPGDDVLLPGAVPDCGVQRCAVGVIRLPSEVGTSGE